MYERIKTRNDVIKQERIVMFDILRGIGILLVVCGHITGGKIHFIINSFHMPLFFIGGGYFISRNNSIAEGRKVYRTPMRLMKYYLWGSLFFMMLNVILKITGVWEGDCISGLLWDLLCTFSLQGISVLWFFTALCMAEVVTGIIVRWLKNRRWAILTGCIFLVMKILIGDSVTNIMDDLMLKKEISLISYGELLVISLIRGGWLSGFTLIGYGIADKLVMLSRSKMDKKKKIIILIMLFGIVLNIVKITSVDYRKMQLQYVLFNILQAFAGYFFCVAIAKIVSTRNTILNRSLSWIGNRSVIIMVAHMLIIEIVCNTWMNQYAPIHNPVILKLAKLVVLLVIQSAILIFVEYMKRIKLQHT